MPKEVVFRVDGGSQFKNDEGRKQGIGHIVRCLSIARKLEEKTCIGLAFIMRDYPKGVEKVVSMGYQVEKIPLDKLNEEIKIVMSILEKLTPNLIVIDLFDTDPSYVKKIRKRIPTVLSMDDLSPGRNDADILIYALKRGPKEHKRGQKIFDGPSYMCIHEVFRELAKKEKTINKSCKSILVTFGGTDHEGLTIKVLEAIDTIDRDLEVTVVLGPAFMHKRAFEQTVKFLNKKVTIKSNISQQEMASLMYDADMAVLSGGVTPFELAAIGTPGIILFQNEAESTQTISNYGTLVNLGLGKYVSKRRIRMAIEDLDKNYCLRKKMSEIGKKTVDGKGVERIANIVFDALK